MSQCESCLEWVEGERPVCGYCACAKRDAE
jgi:hypothetical protein